MMQRTFSFALIVFLFAAAVSAQEIKVDPRHAADMEAGKISMLDDGLIFDRALESIIDNLRSSRKD